MKKKDKKKRINYPVHKMGKHYGYTEYENGDIQIAPSHADLMDEALLEKQGIDEILEVIATHCNKLLIPIAKKKERFWKQVAEDYGLDLLKYKYVYSRTTGIISRKLREDTCKTEK